MKRPFVAIGGGFLVGCFLASYIHFLILLICIPITAITIFIYALKQKKKALLIGAGVFFCCTLLGTILFTFKTQLNYERVIVLDQQTATITATVTDYQMRRNNHYTYYLQVESVTLDNPLEKPYQDDFDLILYATYGFDVNLYDKITLPVSFFLPENHDLFDSVRYHQSNHIYLLASTQVEEVQIASPKVKPLLYYAKMINNTLSANLEARLSPQGASLLKGMILGNRNHFDFDLKQDYINTGTIHLLAISGIHLAILSGLLLKLCKRFSPLIKLLLISILLIGFIIISGLQLSAIRSGIMLFLILLGMVFRRQSDAFNSLCIAGFLIVLFNVYAIMDIGFIMSFLATLGIIVVYPVLYQKIILYFHITNRFANKLIEPVCVSLSANLFLIPVFVLQFGVLSIISPIVNLIIGLTVTPILILGFILTIISGIPIFGFIFQIEDALIQFQNHIISFFGDLPFATIGLNFTPLHVWLWMSLFLLAIGFIWRKQGFLKLSVLFTVGLFVFLYGYCKFELHNSVQIHIVGDGGHSSILFLYGTQATVISPSDDDYIDKSVLNFLKQKGIRTIDNLFLTSSRFTAYDDTIALIHNLPVQNILYHKNNGCHFILEETSSGYYKNLIPISDNFEALTVGSFLTISTDYSNQALNLTVSCYDIPIFIGTQTAAKKTNSLITFLRGTVTQPANHETVSILLEKPYYRQEIPEGYLYSYQNHLEFRIKKDHQVTLIE